MATELQTEHVLEEAEQILRINTRGFAWAPWIDRRYGFVNGVIIPLMTRLSPFSELPPIVENAPVAGREDLRAVQNYRRRKAA